MRNTRRAILRAVPLFVLPLSLLLPRPGAAQRPEPPVPDTTPAPPTSYTAPGPGGMAARIQTLERQRFDAMVQGDRDLLGHVLSDDLTYTHSTGAVDTKASLLSSLASGKLRYAAITPSEVQVKLFGDETAIVTGKVDFKVVSDGKKLSFLARFTSVYTRRNGRWQLAAWQSTRLAQ